MNNPNYFPGITLLVTHYNRSGSLERLLAALDRLNCRFDDIVVSDDGSKPEHIKKLDELQQLYNFRLITSPVNKGFGNNINKGQDAVRTPYTLYIQEDFAPTAIFPVSLQDAFRFMKEDSELDYIRFWSHYRYPKLKTYGKGFSEIIYNPWGLSHLKFFMYSDNPHLRRSSFLQKFGRYQEGSDSNITEYRMSLSFMQKKGKGLFFEEYGALFEHKNSNDEPSTVSRSAWRQSRKPWFRIMRWFYLRFKWLKCTYELKFMRF